MSVYQKFIESATSPQRKRQSVFDYKQQTSSSLTNMIKQTNLPTLAAAALANGAGFVSTPISKQQYKKLVEADHRAIRHREEEDERRRKQQNYYTNQHDKQYYTMAQCKTPNCCNNQQQQYEHQKRASSSCSFTPILDSFFKTDDPVLLKWLQAMRFETDLETAVLQGRTLAVDEYSAGALSVRNSQVYIQEMRLESNFILDYIDYLIECLPLKYQTIGKFYIEFTELYSRLMNQTTTTTTTQQNQFIQTNPLNSSNKLNNLPIINCTPRKMVSQASARSLQPLDKLAVQIRNLCIDYANLLYYYQEDDNLSSNLDNGQLEATLRKLKELYGKYVEIAIRAECANIVHALHYDFSKTSLNRLSSTSSLLVHPVRPFESSSSQLPLKWALIALWQLTKDDSYICRTLTEKWETVATTTTTNTNVATTAKSDKVRSSVAKRLDYSTKYDKPLTNISGNNTEEHSLRSDYQKLYQICQNDEQYQQRQRENEENMTTTTTKTTGALNSALQRKQLQPTKQVSTIELLIDVIISQPNKHERLDMMNFIHTEAQNDKLIDLDEWDQSVSAAIYTSNQYKVAALRILNHLCVNEQAVKTILKCFSTPPPKQGQPIPENKIIRSIFECYQTSQEHIYQNETMFHSVNQSRTGGRKKFCKQQQQLQDEQEDYYSDYGSRQTMTNSNQTSGGSQVGTVSDDLSDEGDDVVVKEAIRLLVQLTTSFHRSNQGLDFYTLIGRFSIDSLVKYLTNIIKSTASREMLFLSLTAIANISFITTDPMRLYGTNRIMLEMFRASKSRSKDLELRDQAVTILANTADKNLLDIVSNAGLTFLLSCLESCPTRMANYKQLERLRREPLSCGEDDQLQQLNIDNRPRDRKPIDFSEDFSDVLNCACDQPPQQQQSQHTMTSSRFNLSSPNSQLLHHHHHHQQQQQTQSLCLSRLSPSDLAAMERIHQKTAVAFARMSADPSTTRMVLKYGGIKRMIDLCKFSQKRNHSDTVLIACIAALRKMAKVIEKDTFKYYNALDLIELELNQTLEIYGNPRMDGQQRLFASDV